ncbi:MAG: FkbM family methyltransferase [Candidatus Moranbacteria bacterium GW2011_GWF2_35_39]|nr:MAG: FkbM family methyltransferase [Candidatus Moranbacteria bacterium GW2011_GWF2_35_39]
MNRFLTRIKKHIKSMRGAMRVSGFGAVFLIYCTKIPLIKKLVKDSLVKARVLGNTMYLKVSDGGLHRRLILRGIREEEHTRQIRDNIKPEMVGIDLGANVGYFAVMESTLVGPRGKVYCIEPEPSNVRLLMKNIFANNFEDRAEVFQYLIGDHNGSEKLYLSEFGNVHSVSAARNKKGSIEVEMITLDKFLEQNELRPEDVDFLRMDIEGYEVMAFQGMQNLLNSKSPFKIFMEFHPSYYPEWGWTFEKLLNYLESYGFKIVEIVRDRETDKNGKNTRLNMKNPTIKEVMEMQKNTLADGCQALLERF